jgi:tryptophanase
MQRKAYSLGVESGALLEPVEARARLACGLAEMTARADAVLGERRRKLELLAAALRKAGVAFLEPVSHAVFVEVPAELLEGGPPRARALEDLLYLVGGVRGLCFPYPTLGRSLLRLCLPLGRYGDAEMERTARAVKEMLARAAEAPRLAPVAGSGLHPNLAHYAPQP